MTAAPAASAGIVAGLEGIVVVDVELVEVVVLEGVVVVEVELVGTVVLEVELVGVVTLVGLGAEGDLGSPVAPATRPGATTANASTITTIASNGCAFRRVREPRRA